MRRFPGSNRDSSGAPNGHAVNAERWGYRRPRERSGSLLAADPDAFIELEIVTYHRLTYFMASGPLPMSVALRTGRVSLPSSMR